VAQDIIVLMASICTPVSLLVNLTLHCSRLAPVAASAMPKEWLTHALAEESTLQTPSLLQTAESTLPTTFLLTVVAEVWSVPSVGSTDGVDLASTVSMVSLCITAVLLANFHPPCIRLVPMAASATPRVSLIPAPRVVLFPCLCLCQSRSPLVFLSRCQFR